MRTSARFAVAATMVSLLSLSATAKAANGPTTEAGREGPLAPSALAGGDPSDIAEARRLYQRATAHYNLQEYKDAIADFQRGYRLHPDAVFLYDIAQAHRLSGAFERALFFYRAYLRAAPDAENRAEVETRIHDLDAALVVTTKPPDNTLDPGPTKPEPRREPPLLTKTDAPPPRRPLYKKWWFWTIGGVVVAGAVVGIAVAATAKHDEVLTPVNLGGN